MLNPSRAWSFESAGFVWSSKSPSPPSGRQKSFSCRLDHTPPLASPNLLQAISIGLIIILTSPDSFLLCVGREEEGAIWLQPKTLLWNFKIPRGWLRAAPLSSCSCYNGSISKHNGIWYSRSVFRRFYVECGSPVSLSYVTNVFQLCLTSLHMKKLH